MRRHVQLSLAGFLATAISYGPARMGFGLFLPEFRGDFALSSGMAGMIASGAFASFVLAIVIAAYLTWRTGARAPVLIGTLAAAAGMAMVAGAGGPLMLAAGVVIAGSSSGFAWSPFNNAAARLVEPTRRPTVLSAVSTGTTVGVAAAGLLAVAFSGFSWRLAWSLFVVGAAVAAVVCFRILSDVADTRNDVGAGRNPMEVASRELFWPCLAALSFGTTASAFLSFAADWVVRSGGIAGVSEATAAPLVFISYGVCGLLGLLTASIESRISLVRFLCLIFACSALSQVLIALAPWMLAAVALAAGLQGACVMTISAIFSFWSARLFPEMPATSFTAVLLSLALGGVLGPALAGGMMDGIGAEAVFLAGAVLSLTTGAALWLGRARIRRDLA